MLLLALGGRWAAGLRPGGWRTPWCAAAALRGSGVALWRATSRAEPARLLSGVLLRGVQPGPRAWGAQVGRPGAGVEGALCGLGGSGAEGTLRVRAPEEQASASGPAAAAKGESDCSFLDWFQFAWFVITTLSLVSSFVRSQGVSVAAASLPSLIGPG